MTRIHDVIVAGLGAMGSATALQLARRGIDVIGFDRYRPPHTFGSSHGGSRIIREAYFEHPVYVPLVQRAYELWDALERDGGSPLYLRTGGLMIGAPDSVLVSGSLRSAREHRLVHEVIDAAGLRRRFPALHAEDGMVGVLEPRAGVLYAERCVALQLDLAARAGATLHYDEPVAHWDVDGDTVRVFTRRGEHRARRLIVSTGASVGETVPALSSQFTVERQTLFWFPAQRAASVFAPENLPVHLWQFDDDEFFYGFPDLGEGVKVARHHRGAATTAASVDRTVSADEIADIRTLVRRFVPEADGEPIATTVCLYTNTSDEHFLIDWLDHTKRVLVVSPCSGHGFKFAPAIGEIAADLVTGREPGFDLTLFRASRSR